MSVQSILRSVVGLALGLDRNDNLVLGGSKLYFYNETASKAGSVDLANLGPSIAKALFLIQGGIPTFLQSSGSVAANGALTGLTAFATTYTDVYLYFPSGAVYAGSAAGSYYCQMSSTTAGTIFDNRYVSGTPTIPATPTPIVAAGPGAYTQTTATAIQLLSATLSGGTMGNNGKMNFDYLSATINNGNTKRAGVIFGAANIQQQQTLTTTIGQGSFVRVRNRGKPASQVSMSSVNQDVGTVTSMNYTGTTNTAVDQTIGFFANLVTAATDFVGFEGYEAALYPN